MKSPITGKEMKIASAKQRLTFRKEEFELFCKFYVCEDTGEQFTDTKLDEWNLNLLHNLYRAKHSIPSIDEIKLIRSSYELSATKMCDILGFGANTYGNYENGDVPTLANARLINLASKPKNFIQLVEDWDEEDQSKKEKVISIVEKKIAENRKKYFKSDLKEYLLGGDNVDEFTGFKKSNFEKFAEMVVFFSLVSACYKTKMNKLLFYADNYAFSQTGYSISGSKYRAIERGPVPYRYESIFDELAENNVIDIFFEDKGEFTTKLLKGRDDRPFNKSLFSEAELQILNKIADKFKNSSIKEIVDLSHEEIAWKNNIASRQLISYQYSAILRGI